MEPVGRAVPATAVEGEAIETDEVADEGELTELSAGAPLETGEEVCAVPGADEVVS